MRSHQVVNLLSTLWKVLQTKKRCLINPPGWQLWRRTVRWKFRMWRRAQPPCSGNGAALPFLPGVPKASSDWSPAPRHQHSSHWGFPNTNFAPQMIQGVVPQLPKILPHFLQLSKAEWSNGRTQCQGGTVLQKTTMIFNKTLGATISNGPETLHCGTAGILTLLFLPTHIYKPLENTKHTIKYLLSLHTYITTIHLPV